MSSRTPPLLSHLIITKYFLFFVLYLVAENLASTIGKRLDERVGRTNDKINKDYFPAYNRDAWLQKFRRFNTAISSLAAVERLFVVGSDILRSKRSSMTKENFKKIFLLRENKKCLKKSIFLHE